MNDTTTTTTPQLPDWIDVDRLCTPGIREMLASLTRQAQELEPAIIDLARRAKLALEMADEERSKIKVTGYDEAEVADGVAALFSAVSGEGALHEIITTLGGHFACVTGGTPMNDPEWYRQLEDEIAQEQRFEYGEPLDG